ncbi:MAG: DUF1269 domain-containing protein [Candidatus Promineifilaceae bacterium]
MSEENSIFDGVIVAAYTNKETADDMLKKVEEAKKAKTFQYWDAAVIRIDERGRYYLNESKDMSTPKGAGIGAVIGGVIGIAGGPAGVILGSGLGAAIGMFAANHDAGIKDERYEEVGHALEADNSALIIVSDRDYLQNMQNYAGEDETAIAMHKLTDGIHEHMVQGNSVAYRITSAGRSVSCHRLRDSDILDLLELEAPED